MFIIALSHEAFVMLIIYVWGLTIHILKTVPGCTCGGRTTESQASVPYYSGQSRGNEQEVNVRTRHRGLVS